MKMQKAKAKAKKTEVEVCLTRIVAAAIKARKSCSDESLDDAIFELKKQIELLNWCRSLGKQRI